MPPPAATFRRFRPHEIRIRFRPRHALAELWAFIPPGERIVLVVIGAAWLAVLCGVVAAFVRAVR